MANIDDINSTLQNIARQLGAHAQSVSNATPDATATSSPASYAINNLGTTAATVIAPNADRYGLMFHNPGTANVYVYPTTVYSYPAMTTTAPTTAIVGGSLLIYPGGTLSFPSTIFANVNCGWSAFSGTGSNQALTVVEFY